ncbi:Uncharacterised protein [uncultured archaeon]|nr:Uncharacterised protein [uncultured archaeon]
MASVKVVQQGLGVIGQSILKELISRGYEIVGVVDKRPDLKGKRLKDLGFTGKYSDLAITDDWRKIIEKTEVDVLSNATVSKFDVLAPDVKAMAESGRIRAVISTCEELSYPHLKHRKLAEELDQTLKQRHVSLLGTGVNPGYVMDTLPLVASAPCLTVERIEIDRIMNASLRREAFQRKIGAGSTRQQFNQLVKEGKIRHVGLTESVAMMTAALGFDIHSSDVEIKESVPEPLLAKYPVKTEFIEVAPGNPSGVHQYATCKIKGKETIRLNFKAAVDLQESYDECRIYPKDGGEPAMKLRCVGGVFGDTATIAMIANCIPYLRTAGPGLKTMLDVPARYRKN